MAEEGIAEQDSRPTPGRITRVILTNYKSIVSCDVELQTLTILVGPNGSGKSNLLDAASTGRQPADYNSGADSADSRP